MFKKLLSYLLAKPIAAAAVRSSSSSLEIRSDVLTVQHKDGNKTFDLTGGMNPQLAAELAEIGLTPADLENVIHLAQEAASGKNKLLSTAPAPITKRWTMRLTSPEAPGANSSQSTGGHVLALGLTGANLLKSGSVSLTVRTNGRKRTYVKAFGMSDETRREMARQLGNSVEELDTLLKMEGHAGEQPLGTAHLPSTDDRQASAGDFPPVGSKPQLVLCPRCTRQVALAPCCSYCGEQLEGRSGAPIG